MTTAEPGALLAESVYRSLVEKIFDGELRPGSPLSVPALAAALDVSRSPVREGVQRLIHEGLAVHVPHAGARVLRLDDDAVRDVLAVREVLDGLAAQEAALRASFADADDLRALVEEQAALLDAPADPRRDARLDLDLHSRVRALSGNAPLVDALRRLDAQAHLHTSGMWDHPDVRAHAVAEHRAIVEAVAAGDAERARAAASAHVAAVGVRMRRWRRTGPSD
ncbi:DNA-binding GntR family transcriptional regulator [Isoptericola jiangsuensis]|uniref:DNA-binding GntR family transcriptional regulator n=1 Tax=Isoptericola jiangsuensis TaxID=548579 RepID=A0A2A9EUH3_9MICO|nr:GntR family transcriptional regulator [Isoptericola jiangsuensis]PFG41885.1 DNA-binding GntR family transcriptional regulator [Isoptericola jiangsuensis]